MDSDSPPGPRHTRASYSRRPEVIATKHTKTVASEQDGQADGQVKQLWVHASASSPMEPNSSPASAKALNMVPVPATTCPRTDR